VDDPRDGEGGSPSKRASGLWDKVRAELLPRLEVLRLPVLLHVHLKEPIRLGTRHVRQLADELIRFAREACPRDQHTRERHEAFSAAAYPLLHEYVEWIYLFRFPDGTCIIDWSCSNLAAACVGVVPSNINDRVVLKSGKTYAWRPGAERWLLLYASGDSVTSRGGPPPPDRSIWRDKDLRIACEASVFDRIVFWDRVRRWHEWLKGATEE
jgi:hypothetical protein